MYTFTAVLHKLEGKIQWTVFYVPFSVQDAYGTNGRVNVKAMIDSHSCTGTLLPSRNGHYMVFNAALREACRKDLGDTVHVTMELDDIPRTVEIPGDILHALEAHEHLLQRFTGQPDYIKREEITKITSAKKQETRERRIEALLAKLAAKA